MKAAILKQNADLVYQDTALPEIPGWYRIKVAFAGICGSDLGRGFKGGAYHYPLIMGHEFSGIVDECPPGGKYPSGTKITVYPLLPCGKCEACHTGHIQLCSHYDYFGSRRDGGFAEYVCVPESNIIPVPERVSLEEAALSEPAAVAHHAIFSAPVSRGSSALVLGGGPIGLLAAQWLRIRGCSSVSVSDIQKEKLELAESLGFTPLPSVANDKTYADKFDICVEACGISATRNAAVVCCKRQGHIFLIGNPAGTLEMESGVYSSILRKELSLNGAWNSLPDQDWKEVLSHAGKDLDLKKLITSIQPLSKAGEVFRNILENREFHCKSLLNCQE